MLQDRSLATENIVRWVYRLIILLLAAAIVAGAVYLGVRAVPALSPASLQHGFLGFRPYRRRLLAPQPGAILDFAGEFASIGLIAFFGRRILRLHL